MPEDKSAGEVAAQADRRKFLLAAGPFVALVPPSMTLLLSTTMSSEAIAASGAVRGANAAGPNSGVPSTQTADPGGGRGGGQGGGLPEGGPSQVANEIPLDRPGQSLVASSPDFNPPQFTPGGSNPSPRTSAAGERG